MATTTACQARRRRARAERPLVSARNSGIVPTGSMMTTRVTKTSVNSFVENAPCETAAAARTSTAPRLVVRLRSASGEARRHRAEGELGLDVPVPQVVQRQRVVEQDTRARRPDQRPQPQALGLADEHGA